MATNDPFGDFRRRRGSLFDEFFSEFFDRPFGIEGATSPTGARTAAPPARRPVEQVDITQFFSDATRELLQRAAQLALDWGSLDLDTWGPTASRRTRGATSPSRSSRTS
jgi:ATP-dependent Clp protease ATP-binding subunit ClpC